MEDEWNALTYSTKEIEYSDSIKEFLDECNLSYEVKDNVINCVVPPSDLYPSSVITEKTFTIIENDEKKEVKFYFCDTMMKPYSQMARDIVVAQIPSIDALNIYDNVVECFNSSRKDYEEYNKRIAVPDSNQPNQPSGKIVSI